MTCDVGNFVDVAGNKLIENRLGLVTFYFQQRGNITSKVLSAYKCMFQNYDITIRPKGSEHIKRRASNDSQ